MNAGSFLSVHRASHDHYQSASPQNRPEGSKNSAKEKTTRDETRSEEAPDEPVTTVRCNDTSDPSKRNKKEWGPPQGICNREENLYGALRQRDHKFLKNRVGIWKEMAKFPSPASFD